MFGPALVRVGDTPFRLRREAETSRFAFDAAQRETVDLLRRRRWSLDQLVVASNLAAEVVQLLVYCLLVTRQVELLPIVDEVEEVRTPGSGPAAVLDAPTVVGHDSWLVPAPDSSIEGVASVPVVFDDAPEVVAPEPKALPVPLAARADDEPLPSDSGLLAGVVPGGGHGRVGGRRAGDTEGRGAVGSQLRPTDTCARSPGGEVAQPSRAEGRPGGGGLHAPDRAEHVGDHAEMEAAYRAEQQAEAKATPSPAAGAMSRPTPIATPAVTIAVKPVDASLAGRGDATGRPTLSFAVDKQLLEAAGAGAPATKRGETAKDGKDSQATEEPAKGEKTSSVDSGWDD